MATVRAAVPLSLPLSFSLFCSFSLIHLDVSAVVDIFNAASGQWTVASLSAARSLLAAASLLVSRCSQSFVALDDADGLNAYTVCHHGFM